MRIERISEVDVWWVQRPVGPRIPPRVALLGALLIVPPLAAALGWVYLRGEGLWPWSTVLAIPPSGPQHLVRYLLLVGGGLSTITLTSLGPWYRLARRARVDLVAARSFAQQGRWEEAALHLHRHALLRGELGHPVDPEPRRLDETVRSHGVGQRRFYIYYTGSPPPLPETPAAGFQPSIVPLTVAGGWWVGGVVVLLALGALAEVHDAFMARQGRALLNPNFALVSVLLLAYGYVYASGFLGRRSYFRFAPGTAELLKFKVRSSKTRAETIPLRVSDVYLDLTRPVTRLAFVDRATRTRVAEYHLDRSPQTIETCLRAVLSEAPVHALPEQELTA